MGLIIMKMVKLTFQVCNRIKKLKDSKILTFNWDNMIKYGNKNFEQQTKINQIIKELKVIQIITKSLTEKLKNEHSNQQDISQEITCKCDLDDEKLD